MKWLAILLLLTTNVLADSDTATSTNILPNAGTASSSMDNFDLDGVNSGQVALQTILHTMDLRLLVAQK
jgi:hypothetical protein